MRDYELIGLICVAAIENNIAMTTVQITKMAEYLTDKGVKVGDHEIKINKSIENPVEELGISKKNRERLRHADMGDILKKPVAQTDTNKRMDDVYLGEHPNIQPAPVEKKPLSPREQQLWDYMQSHPDSRMPKTCEDLNLSQANYFWLKQQLKKKGWIISAVENVKEFN